MQKGHTYDGDGEEYINKSQNSLRYDINSYLYVFNIILHILKDITAHFAQNSYNEIFPMTLCIFVA